MQVIDSLASCTRPTGDDTDQQHGARDASLTCELRARVLDAVGAGKVLRSNSCVSVREAEKKEENGQTSVPVEYKYNQA